jgi:hypothetical protein
MTTSAKRASPALRRFPARVRFISCALGVLLASCTGASLYRDFSEPLTVEDFEPLPNHVTPENARAVVRRCLQAHRQSAATPDTEWGYAFRPEGFVQLCHERPENREEERAIRTYVDYHALQVSPAVPQYNLRMLKEEFAVTLRGPMRRWQTHVRAFEEQPNLGAESATMPVHALTLVLDDPVAAHRLSDALQLLGAP